LQIGNWKSEIGNSEVIMSVDKDLVSVQQARDLVEAAHKAQSLIAEFDQAKVDRICEAMAGAALRESARLGAIAVEETGYGIPDDKREKNRFAAEDVWNYFRGTADQRSCF
jgi:acetaldehyde dehydrogenase (acetylating)